MKMEGNTMKRMLKTMRTAMAMLLVAAMLISMTGCAITPLQPRSADKDAATAKPVALRRWAMRTSPL